MLAGELRGGRSDQPYAAARDRVVAAVRTALDIDPDLGLSYVVLSSLEAFASYSAREALFEKALSVAPNDPDVLTSAAFFAAEVGHIGEALALARQAYELDPVKFGTCYAYASFLDFAGRYDETKALWDSFCARWPESEMMVDAAMAAALQNADWARFRRLAKAPTGAPDPHQRRRGMTWLARNLESPDPAAIDRFLERLRSELAANGTLRPDMLASLYNLGRRDETFHLIDQASFAFMFDPKLGWPYGSLHGGYIFSVSANGGMMADPRFPRLCGRLGLCGYWIESGRWPDCAEQVDYDFRAEARRLAGAAPPGG